MLIMYNVELLLLLAFCEVYIEAQRHVHDNYVQQLLLHAIFSAGWMVRMYTIQNIYEYNANAANTFELLTE